MGDTNTSLSTYENIFSRRLYTAILCFLAKNGPTNMYRVSKETGIKYPTTHKRFKEMKSFGLIKLERVAKSEKGGEAKVYGLTLFGLCCSLMSGELWETLDEVIERWKHLDPLLLGNWKHLVSIGPYEEAVQALKGAATSVCDFVPEGYSVGAIRKDEDIQPLLWTEFSGRLIGVYSKFHMEKWIEAIRSVPNLNDWIKKYYQKSLAFQQSLSRWDNKVLRALKGDRVNFRDVSEQLKKAFEEVTRMYFKNATEEFIKSQRVPFH